MHRGIHPLLYDQPKEDDWTDDVEKRFLAALEKGQRECFIAKGSTIIMISGWRPGPAHINTIRVFVVE